ncbi:hypothetical protein ARMGADRAFT_347556 [Armillaria gallica]|uniref:Nephrocystin 3-like N-terminal domain-containing protein n=1 Tax=Armillaria gallica TaxID=47427 RepID=A0A2H3DL47_ARMGA|nr:hypothetical protein ARMGADRAFT_347556 [Armillaria gallica]
MLHTVIRQTLHPTTTNKATMSDRKRPRPPSYIQRVEVHDLNPLPPDGSRISLEIVVDFQLRKKIHKKPTFKMHSEVTPTWSVGLALDDLEQSTLVKFELYRCGKSPFMPKKSLGWAQRSVSDLLSSSDIAVSTSPPSIFSFRIFYDDSRQTANGLIQMTPTPMQPQRIMQLLNAIRSMKQMIDVLAEVHPAADVAWSIVSVGINILDSQVKTNEVVKDLYATMLSTYEQASKDELWKGRNRLGSVYDSLFKYTIECSIFINGYMQKGWAGRMFSLDLAEKAKEFQEGFEDLRDQLHAGITTETLLVTLELEEKIDDIGMQELLRDLCPPAVLKAKSKCMNHTRTETINDLMSWITQCSGGVLWCNGIAGTGKSSIVGTLHEFLTFHASECDRLAAFIRYDTEYQNTSHLITSIAHSLGLFDKRIGGAISRVLRKNRSVLGFPESSAKEQFRILIQDPLKSLPELANEGCLVVLIDGLDECKVCEEMLTVLSGGFGPDLPFMRLLVFSRPVDLISKAFNAPNTNVTSLILDTTSEYVNRDIRCFIDTKLAALYPDDEDFYRECEQTEAVDKLAQLAGGLFLAADTFCQYLSAYPCTGRLQALLDTADNRMPKESIDPLTTLYLAALANFRSDDVRKGVRAVLGAIMVPGADLTPEALDALVLTKKDPRAQVILDKLGSIVQSLGAERNRIVPRIHQLLEDFFRDRGRCGETWFIDIEDHGRKLAKRCYRSLDTFLKSWPFNRDNIRNIEQCRSEIPCHILDYVVVGPLRHIGYSDIADISVLFEDQKLSLWLQLASIARKEHILLDEFVKVLSWVNDQTRIQTTFVYSPIVHVNVPNWS